jgi:hypothetical protein
LETADVLYQCAHVYMKNGWSVRRKVGLNVIFIRNVHWFITWDGAI